MTGCSGGDEPRLTSGPRTFIKLAALAAIEEVDEEADDEPDEEAHPGARGQAGHQQYAEDDAEYREERAAGNAEAAVALGLVAAVILALLTGLPPAIRAMRLQIVDALAGR